MKIGNLPFFQTAMASLFCLFLVACGGAEDEISDPGSGPTPDNPVVDDKPVNPDPAEPSSQTDKDILSKGRALYTEQCAVCHGDNGMGVPKLGPQIFDWSDRAQALVDKILISMPTGAVNNCDLDCSKLTAAYILADYDENGALTSDITFDTGRAGTSTLQMLASLGDDAKNKIYQNRTNFTLPALVEAEHFDTGGDGVSFSDTTPEKMGDASMRADAAVDILVKYNRISVGWFPPGEWIDHTFYLDQPMVLKIDWVMASNQSEVGFDWSINGQAQGEKRFPAKSDWSQFVSSDTVTPLLDKGWHTIRFSPTVQMSFDHFILSKADRQPVDDASLAFDLPPALIYRLTNYEYLQTVNNLFGSDFSYVVDEFDSDTTTNGFSKIAQGLEIDKRRLEQYYDAALKISADVMGNATLASRIISCDLSTDTVDNCGSQLISDWGLKITRHPLTSEEQARYVSLLDLELRRGSSDREAFGRVLSHMLFSASFLHHIEAQPTEDPDSPIYTLSSYELANRLSYFLWCSAPDDTLFDLAKNGDLLDENTLAAEVNRMLADERSRCLVDSVADQWLNLKKTETVTVGLDGTDFDGWKPSLAKDMVKETKDFMMHLFRENRPVEELLGADYSFMSNDLAEFYGLGTPDPTTGRIQLPASSNRQGLLTQGSLLTLTRSGSNTFIHRGILVLDKLLCSAPPPPPENLEIAGSSEQDSCQGCHKFINPPGSGLNHFDEVGRYKTVDENDQAISAEGNFFDGPAFTNALDMISIVKEDDRLAPCVLDQYFGYSIASVSETYNKKAREDVFSAWASRGLGFQDMLVAIVTSPSFQYRRISASQ